MNWDQLLMLRRPQMLERAERDLAQYLEDQDYSKLRADEMAEIAVDAAVAPVRIGGKRLSITETKS